MEEGQRLVRCGNGGVGPPTLGRSLSLQGRHGPPALRSDPPWKDRARGCGQESRVAMVKPAVISGATQTNRKTSLTRSVSLSDKELREARDRSQIIAAQLTFQSNANSRGVQLFNRRKQRVNAFTRTSFGQGVGQGGDGQPRQPLTWKERHTEKEGSQSDCRNSEPDPARSPGVVKEGGERMEEEWGEPVPLEGPPAACMEEEVDQDLSGQCEIREPIPKEDTPIEVASIEDTPIEVVSIEDTPIEVVSIEDTTVEIAPIEDTPIEQVSIEETPTEPMPCEVKQCEDIPLKASPPDDIRATAVPADVGEREEVVTPSKVTNGCHVAPNTSRVTLSLAKQAPVTVNRTARPFGATATTTVRSPVDFPPPPSCVTPPLPRIYSPPPSAFSPPPPMTYSTPSNPNHNLPAYSKATPPAYSNPSPVAYSSAAAQVYSDPNPPAYSSRSPQVYTNPPPPPPPYCSPPPLSRVISPSPCLPQYGHPSAPRPTYIPDLLVDRRQAASPIKTGILEDGKTRRAARKSMFTFQEKPKVAPNPELLSLVQGVDQRKRGPSLPEPPPEEELELLALGAEASNFLPKGGEVGGAGLEEAAMPEWSSCLKSSGAPVRQEPKVEQGLANASGKGAELFARRQTRMERFESAGGAYGRAPSPTASLPPSWTFPSHMPGRVKAMVDISNASVTSSAQAPPARTAKPRPGAAMAPPPPRPESPVLENGCTKLEMEISRHKPYQLNSSLFILNPTRDPMSSLPKAAPPPKPVLNRAHGRHTSLPAHNPPPLSPHYTSPAPFRPFSPQAPLSPVNGAGFSDLRSNCTPPPPWPGTSHIASSVFARSPERPPAPRNVVQAPRPTFSAKKAGLEPQTRRESLPTPTTPTRTTPVPMATPTASQQLRRFSSPEALAGGLKFRPASPVPPPSSASRSLHPSSFSSPLSPSQETRCQSPLAGPEAKANRRLLAQNIINAAKRKNSPSPGGQNGRAGCLSPFQPRPLGGHSPTLASPPPTPTRSARSPVRLYATRSLTDSDASLESEDSGLRSPGLRSYNTCPRGWGGSLRIKRGTIHADL
ncbi:synaptopodin isoform X2 [Conger conger]|uniref:synaptopodin isoform X2 n=1 Tax=Conger conger TaxID=82655 RepID=UPI002A5AB0D4|nr:synaptopodin isoform X2 [Conger conger]